MPTRLKVIFFDIALLNIKLSLIQMNITALGTLVTTALNLNHSGAVDTELPHQIYSPFLTEITMLLTWLKIQLSHLYQKKKVEIEGQDLTPDDQVANQ